MLIPLAAELPATTFVATGNQSLPLTGTTIVSAPADGPFGRAFTFADPDRYQVTLHDRG
jgi:hypothetical protein